MPSARDYIEGFRVDPGDNGARAGSEKQDDQSTTEGFGRASDVRFPRTRLTIPVLGEAAYHGIAGEFVRLVEPETEADPAAILVQFLAAAGSAMGANPYVRIGNTRHGAKLFVVVVGTSSVSRKGTGGDLAEALVGQAAPSWWERQVSNLGSGEVVIWAIRDPEQRGKETDPGVADKRLFVRAGEFSSVLRVAGRSGSILSPILRESWDRDVLRHTAKANPAKATGAHVVVIGHITKTELRRELSSTETANGFGNRFLWVVSRRSKELPRGGEIDQAALDSLAGRLKSKLDYGTEQHEVIHDGGFWQVYESAYSELTSELPGMRGALLARGAPYVHRLALIFALLDGVSVIGRQHAEAALAVWRYCAQSATYIFGDSLGSPVAEEILRELRNRPEGMTRTEIRDFLHRNARIGSALDELHEARLAYPVRERTVGRTAERWHAGALDNNNGTTETTEGAPQPAPAGHVPASHMGRRPNGFNKRFPVTAEIPHPNGDGTPDMAPCADADAGLRLFEAPDGIDPDRPFLPGAPRLEP